MRPSNLYVMKDLEMMLYLIIYSPTTKTLLTDECLTNYPMFMFFPLVNNLHHVPEHY